MSELFSNPRPTVSVERATEADLKELMMGTTGNPSYQEQFGITSAPLGSNGAPPQPSLAELELQAKIAEARALDPAGYAEQQAHLQEQPPSDSPDILTELEKFKKLYGDSENEKGAARRREAELMEAFNGLMAQYQELQTTPQQPGWGAQNNPTQFSGYPPQQNYNQPYFDPFEGIGDDDVIQGKQVKGLFEKTLAPAVAASWQQSQQAMQRMAMLEKQLLTQAKAASGISPMDEYRLMSKNPWLKNLPDANRLQALSSLKQAEVAIAPPAQGLPNSTQATEAQSRIVNKVTYIEGNTPKTSDTSQVALEAARQRDFAVAMTKPLETGERARALRIFAEKYGLNFGQHPSDIAR